MSEKPLSPCVQSAILSSTDEVTAWDIVKKLLKMHPECTHGLMDQYIPAVDQAYHGEKKLTVRWLEAVAQQYPQEDLLHTRLVILGLYAVDPELNKLLPKELMTLIEEETTFSRSSERHDA